MKALLLGVLVYVNTAPEPYARLADMAARNWNRAANCRVLDRRVEGPVQVTAWRFGQTRWAGFAWQYGDTEIHVAAQNASVMDAWSEHHKLAVYCHEFGHVLGLEHSDDPASCMGLGFESHVPGPGDEAALTGVCDEGRAEVCDSLSLPAGERE